MHSHYVYTKLATGSHDELSLLCVIWTDTYESMYDEKFEQACTLADSPGRKHLQNGAAFGSYTDDLVSTIVATSTMDLGFTKFKEDIRKLHEQHGSTVDDAIVEKWKIITASATKCRLLLEALFGEADAILFKRNLEYRVWIATRVDKVRSTAYSPPDKVIEQWCVLPGNPYYLVPVTLRVRFKHGLTDEFIERVLSYVTETFPITQGASKEVPSLRGPLKELQARLKKDGVDKGWVVLKIDSALGWVWCVPLDVEMYGMYRPGAK